jgi:hypothetical protein
MDVHEPKGVTRRPGEPAGWDREKAGPVGALPIIDHKIDGVPFMRSHWRPSPAEMAALDAGGTITLDISGTVHPVVRVGVEPGAIVPLESASRRIAIAIAGAVEAVLEQARRTMPGAYLAVSPCKVDQEGAGIRWGIIRDPARIRADFAHWTIIGPIDAEGTDPADPMLFPEDMVAEADLPDLPDFLRGDRP